MFKLVNSFIQMHSNLLKKRRNSSWAVNISKVYIGDVISSIIAAVTLVIIIRNVSINDYANYTAFHTILTLFPALIGSGINLAMIRFSSEHFSKTGERHINLYLISFILQIVIYIVFCSVIIFLKDNITAILFGEKEFNSAFLFGAIGGFGFLVFQAGISVYKAEEKFNTYIGLNWFKYGFILILICGLFLFQRLKFENIAVSIIFVNLILAAIIIFQIFRDYNLLKILASIYSYLNSFIEFFSSTAWLMAFIFTITAFQRIDIFMLSHFSINEELANYGVAFQYYLLALLFLNSINTVLLPKFSKVEMQNSKSQLQFLQKWIKTTWWLIIPIVLFDIFGKTLFLWISGKQYEKAFYIFIIFTGGIWLSILLSPLINILMARKNFKFLFILSLVALVFNFIGNYIFIPKWHGYAAALVAILSHGIINIFAFLKCLGLSQIFVKMRISRDNIGSK